MEFDRSPEENALARLHAAVAEMADPSLTFTPEQLARAGTSYAMLRYLHDVRRVSPGNPGFDDYRSARVMAWATGSTGATYNDVRYTKADDDHGIRECDADGAGGSCSRCRSAYRHQLRQADNTINGNVSGVAVQVRDIDGGLKL
jgi:hypothetical protein